MCPFDAPIPIGASILLCTTYVNANACQASGADLRARRLSLGLSQESVARTVNCSAGYVRLLESGYAPGRSDVLPRVIAALNDERAA